MSIGRSFSVSANSRGDKFPKPELKQFHAIESRPADQGRDIGNDHHRGSFSLLRNMWLQNNPPLLILFLTISFQFMDKFPILAVLCSKRQEEFHVYSNLDL